METKLNHDFKRLVHNAVYNRQLQNKEKHQLLNCLATIYNLDYELTQLSHTTFYKKEVKYFANKLADLLAKEINDNIAMLFDVNAEEMEAIVSNKEVLIKDTFDLSAEDWQYVAAMIKLVKRTDLVEYYQIKSIFQKIENKL